MTKYNPDDHLDWYKAIVEDPSAAKRFSDYLEQIGVYESIVLFWRTGTKETMLNAAKNTIAWTTAKGHCPRRSN